MNVFARIILVLCVVLCGSVSLAQEPDWLLADADDIAAPSYIILTVPLDEAPALRAVAAEIASRYDVSLAAEWPLRSIAVHCLVMDARGHSNLGDLLTRMRADARIRTAQPMQEFEVFEGPGGGEQYDDPLLPSQQAMQMLNAVKAHQRTMGEGVRIGVVDSGIDKDHPDLSQRVIDARDFVKQRRSVAAEPHGTAIAGVIGADARNGAGIVGVAPGAELVGLRACWQSPGKPGRCSSFSLARALNFAILNEIKVLNLSLGGPPDPLLEELVLRAIQNGSVVVAAWGESGQAVFPASVPGVIAAGRRKFGGIPAPYIDVISTAPGGRYRFVSGSSVAAAHVSGVVALLLASNANLSSSEIEQILSGSLREQEGGPLLDACAALATLLGSTENCRN